MNVVGNIGTDILGPNAQSIRFGDTVLEPTIFDVLSGFGAEDKILCSVYTVQLLVNVRQYGRVESIGGILREEFSQCNGSVNKVVKNRSKLGFPSAKTRDKSSGKKQTPH